MCSNFDFEIPSVSDNAIYYFINNDSNNADAETLQVISDNLIIAQEDINNGLVMLIFAIGLLIGFLSFKSILGKG